MMLEMAVLAPTPSASDSTATVVNPGLLRNLRRPAQAVADILDQAVPPRPSPHVARGLLNQTHVAESSVRRVRSFVNRDSGCGLFFGLEV